jgi:hypothetical protein
MLFSHPWIRAAIRGHQRVPSICDGALLNSLCSKVMPFSAHVDSKGMGGSSTPLNLDSFLESLTLLIE